VPSAPACSLPTLEPCDHRSETFENTPRAVKSQLLALDQGSNYRLNRIRWPPPDEFRA
jgi:hypothetical protein